MNEIILWLSIAKTCYAHIIFKIFPKGQGREPYQDGVKVKKKNYCNICVAKCPNVLFWK